MPFLFCQANAFYHMSCINNAKLHCEYFEMLRNAPTRLPQASQHRQSFPSSRRLFKDLPTTRLVSVTYLIFLAPCPKMPSANQVQRCTIVKILWSAYRARPCFFIFLVSIRLASSFFLHLFPPTARRLLLLLQLIVERKNPKLSLNCQSTPSTECKPWVDIFERAITTPLCVQRW